MTEIAAAGVAVAAATVLVRARPWSALVNRAPWAWLRELGLCAWCLGFWLGVSVGALMEPTTLQGFGQSVVLGFCVSFTAGTVNAVIRVLERVADALDLYISEKLK